MLAELRVSLPCGANRLLPKLMSGEIHNAIALRGDRQTRTAQGESNWVLVAPD